MAEKDMPADRDEFVRRYLDTSVAAMTAFAADPVARRTLQAMAEIIAEAFNGGRKLLLAGNGGSAADAQHIACELVGRFLLERHPLPAIALTTDSSSLTAIANDYGFESVFERQVLGLARDGDVFIGLSTSGNSPNIVRALEAAKTRGVRTLGFTGAAESKMTALCDVLLAVPSSWTPVIQQLHITAAHIVCALVEQIMFPTGSS